MQTYEVLLFLHLIGAFMIVAGAAIGTAVLLVMRRTRSTRMLNEMLRLERLSPMLTIPGALIALVFGTWLVTEANYQFSEAWISLSYLLWFVALGLSAGVLGRSSARAHAIATRELAAGREESPELIAAVLDPKVTTVMNVLHVITLLFFALMVFKPGH